jgi:hypothetical protein
MGIGIILIVETILNQAPKEYLYSMEKAQRLDGDRHTKYA